MSRQPSWREAFDAAIDAKLNVLHTCCPATFVSYDESSQTAELRPGIRTRQPGGVYEDLPNLPDVPVIWPGNWAAGDSALIWFSEESFGGWFDDGEASDPEMRDRHGLHALCIPIVARAGDAVDFVALQQLVMDRLAAMQTLIDSHIHTTAMGPSGIPTPAILWGNEAVAAAKVKAR